MDCKCSLFSILRVNDMICLGEFFSRRWNSKSEVFLNVFRYFIEVWHVLNYDLDQEKNIQENFSTYWPTGVRFSYSCSLWPRTKEDTLLYVTMSWTCQKYCSTRKKCSNCFWLIGVTCSMATIWFFFHNPQTFFF